MNIGDKVVIKTSMGLTDGEIIKILKDGRIKVAIEPVLKGNRCYYPKGVERDFSRSWLRCLIVKVSEVTPLVLRRDSNTQVTTSDKG